MADRMLSDARSLMAALKSLDGVMKASLQTLQKVATPSTAAAAGRATTVIRKPGQQGGDDDSASKPEQIRRNDKVINENVLAYNIYKYIFIYTC